MRKTVLLAVLISSLLFVLDGPSKAGTLSFTVNGVHLNPASVDNRTYLTVTYNLGGSAFNIPGGLLNVELEILSGETVVKSRRIYPGEPGAKQGANAVVVNPTDLPSLGAYSVRVRANGVEVTAPDYVRVSSITDGNLQFANPRGVDVNRVSGSPYLGRVYVTEGAGGTAGGRTTVDGVYVLNPDQTPAFAQPKATSALIGSLGPWGGSANSPYRPVVDGEGRVFITDVSDPHSGVFVADGNVDGVSAFFAYPYPSGGSRDAGGLVKNSAGVSIHGSTSSISVSGVGATRTVTTTDEDVPPGNSIWKREVPAGATNLAVPPVFVATPTGADWVADHVRDAAGNTYFVSLTANDARKYDASGALQTTLPASGAGYFGICLDETANAIFIATNDGRILRTTPAFDAFSVIWAGGGAEIRDVALDGNGWIYSLNSSDRRLEVLALGDFATEGSTASAAETLTVVSVPVPGDIAPVGPEGRWLGANGLRYGDDSVNILDAVYLARMAMGLAPTP